MYCEHPKTPDRSPGTNLDFLEMVKKGISEEDKKGVSEEGKKGISEVDKKGVSEECKNKGLEKDDPGDKDSSGPAGASISC